MVTLRMTFAIKMAILSESIKISLTQVLESMSKIVLM